MKKEKKKDIKKEISVDQLHEDYNNDITCNYELHIYIYIKGGTENNKKKQKKN